MNVSSEFHFVYLEGFRLFFLQVIYVSIYSPRGMCGMEYMGIA